MHNVFIKFIVGILCLLTTPIFADDFECGNPFVNGVGPYDYNDPNLRKKRLPIVETYHFTPEVENLIRGETDIHILHDIDYTLRAFPNHHRALYTLARYRLSKSWRKGKYLSAECYFDRAIRFRPDDPLVYVVYGIYLAKLGRKSKALTEYKKALQLAPESSEIHYNLGLLYVDLKKHELAVSHAIKAYELGYPLQGLKKKLIEKKLWPKLKPQINHGE